MIGDNARKLGLAPSPNEHGGRRRHRVALQEPRPSKGRAAQPLERVAEGYRAMDERRAIKALLRP